MGRVGFEEVTKVYDDGTTAVSGLSLQIDDGEFLVLVGPSGCGKTTALRMVAGLEDISGGTISIGERAVNDVPPRDRDIAMVFQSYALYPHLSVYENIAFGLRVAKLDKTEIDQRVQRAAATLDLTGLLDRKPRALSGGQRQRVAMGRAIVREPQAFLMDEPLSNLDAKLRVQMRAEIAGLQRDLGVTTLYVTHDQVEAMTMGHRVAVMRKGVLQQVAAPQELYDRPVNLFVAGFIGSPGMNLLEATLQQDHILVGDQQLPLPDGTLAAHEGLGEHLGKRIVVGIRPEDIEDAAIGAPGPRLKATVQLVEALGSEVMAHLRVNGRLAETDEVKELAEDAGVKGLPEDSGTAPLVARFSARSRVKPSDAIEVSVDTSSLHFFDPGTGLGLNTRALEGAHP